MLNLTNNMLLNDRMNIPLASDTKILSFNIHPKILLKIEQKLIIVENDASQNVVDLLQGALKIRTIVDLFFPNHNFKISQIIV